jgi:multidrug efflux pump subunit AcrB
MWIARLALRRPYTFIVMGVVIVLIGVFAIVTTPTDLFPEIDIPVVSVVWN